MRLPRWVLPAVIAAATLTFGFAPTASSFVFAGAALMIAALALVGFEALVLLRDRSID